MDKIKALETFIAVADGGGFAAAARKLKTSAPSVTRIIGELEADLGIALLHRTTRVVSLTEIGKCYLSDAKQLINALVTADDNAKGAHGTPKGLLRITASNMFGQIYVMPVVVDYLNQYKDVTIETMFVDRVVNMIEEGLDISVRIGELGDSALMATKVGHVCPSICGCPSYFEKYGTPNKPEDLLNHQTIGLAHNNFSDNWVFANGQSVKLKHRLVVNDITSGIKAAKEGFGILRVLSYQIGPELDTGCVKTVLNDYAPTSLPIHVMHAQGRRTSAKVRSFVDLMAQSLKQNRFIN